MRSRQAFLLAAILLAAVSSSLPASSLPAEEPLLLSPAGPAIVHADTAALVLSGQRGGSIPLAARAASADGSEVLLAVLDGGALAEKAEDGHLSLAVFIYALGAKGETLAHASQRFEADAEALRSGGLRIAVALPPIAAPHEVRFLLRTADIFALTTVAVDPTALEPLTEPAEVAELPAGHWYAAVPGEGPSPSWPELSAEASSPEVAGPESVLDVLAERQEKLPRPEIVAGYLTALTRLAANEREEALRSLYEIEGLCASEGDAGLRKLADVRSAILTAISRRSPAAVWPIVLLHADATDGYARAGRALLSRYAARTTSEITADLSRENGEGRTASQLLAAMAGDALKRGDPAQTEDLLDDALHFDPKNPAALLTLATIYERGGQIQEAVDLLERLTAAAPDHAEGKLRLAVNLLRAGRHDDGERLLDRLCREHGDWTGRVACEEQARYAVLRGHFDEAEEILSAALERFATDRFSLALQRAYVLDRLGRSREAEKQLTRLDRPADASASNERYQYNQWPFPALSEERRQVEERAAGALEELAGILKRIPGAPSAGGGP